ncbi:hypothetical protein CKAH01_02276 [Colletotrichum kahawae]|uniref:Uncharacterized protein n=1 Tax=Colletotrichum kahawae TaxID=34407 RepID=A0AAD9XZU9_COLKA|nr:hypothetical protein CKAH01_02276 [Colletotrichum kahawae]
MDTASEDCHGPCSERALFPVSVARLLSLVLSTEETSLVTAAHFVVHRQGFCANSTLLSLSVIYTQCSLWPPSIRMSFVAFSPSIPHSLTWPTAPLTFFSW